jgi:hypothetical protein
MSACKIRSAKSYYLEINPGFLLLINNSIFKVSGNQGGTYRVYLNIHDALLETEIFPF